MLEATTDYAIDIESLSTSRVDLVAIVEIGAVEFDRETGAILREFHELIDLDSALLFGKVNADTLRFWFSQDHAEETMNIGYRQSIPDALMSLNSFLVKGARTRYWSWGSEFDLRNLKGTFETIGYPDFLDHRDVRDARGYCTELSEQFGIELPRQDLSTKHHALDDARHCAKLVSGVYQQMMVVAERMACWYSTKWEDGKHDSKS